MRESKKSDSVSNVDIVQAQVDAYNAGSLEAFLLCYHPDVEVFNLSEMEPIIKGADEMRQRYGRIFRDNPHLQCQIRHRQDYGSFVIDEEFVTGHRDFPDGLRAGAIYQVVDRVIRTVWFTR
jgi:hypothetical protein